MSHNGDSWRVENSSRSTVDYIGKDGRVEDGSRSTISLCGTYPHMGGDALLLLPLPIGAFTGTQGTTIFADPLCT
ncbi:MAG: hypothetical protein IPH00_15990 [Flavobacteriales bacterium]|nr:hypothetical protein [Flavobacteriales bacterium]